MDRLLPSYRTHYGLVKKGLQIGFALIYAAGKRDMPGFLWLTGGEVWITIGAYHTKDV
jgi:hypothetical protein